MDTKEAFAKDYLAIYNRAIEDLKNIPWYRFGHREHTKKRMRWADYHYKKLTNKHIDENSGK